MNCQSFVETVSELARDQSSDQIDADLRATTLEHLETCAECGLSLRDQRALTGGLRQLAREMKSLTTPARVEAEVLAAFRQTRQRSEVREQRSGVSSRWILAVAAVLLIMLGVGSLRWYLRHLRPGSLESPNPVAENSPKQLPSIVEVQPNSSPTNPEKQLTERLAAGPKPNRRVRPLNRDRKTDRQVTAKATTTTANDVEREVATYFMPLSYGGPINPQDGGQLVRVELPRSAMLSMGLPVNMDRYGERVKADVLLGPDGLARAIRFVQ